MKLRIVLLGNLCLLAILGSLQPQLNAAKHAKKRESIVGTWHYKQYLSAFPNPKELSVSNPELVYINYGVTIHHCDGHYSGQSTASLTNPVPPNGSLYPSRAIVFRGNQKKISSKVYSLKDIGYIANFDSAIPYLPISLPSQIAFLDKSTFTIDDTCTSGFGDGVFKLYLPDDVKFTTPLSTLYFQWDGYKLN